MVEVGREAGMALGVMMSVWINGVRRDLDSKVETVAGLLETLGVPGQGTLVEQNGEALFPRDFGSSPVAAGDRFELVRIAAGG